MRQLFTQDEKHLLAKYISKCGNVNRKGNTLYKDLVADPRLSWTHTHTWQSWREQYSKNPFYYDRLIQSFQERRGQSASQSNRKNGSRAPLSQAYRQGPAPKRSGSSISGSKRPIGEELAARSQSQPLSLSQSQSQSRMRKRMRLSQPTASNASASTSQAGSSRRNQTPNERKRTTSHDHMSSRTSDSFDADAMPVDEEARDLPHAQADAPMSEVLELLPDSMLDKIKRDLTEDQREILLGTMIEYGSGDTSVLEVASERIDRAFDASELGSYIYHEGAERARRSFARVLKQRRAEERAERERVEAYVAADRAEEDVQENEDDDFVEANSRIVSNGEENRQDDTPARDTSVAYNHPLGAAHDNDIPPYLRSESRSYMVKRSGSEAGESSSNTGESDQDDVRVKREKLVPEMQQKESVDKTNNANNANKSASKTLAMSPPKSAATQRKSKRQNFTAEEDKIIVAWLRLYPDERMGNNMWYELAERTPWRTNGLSWRQRYLPRSGYFRELMRNEPEYSLEELGVLPEPETDSEESEDEESREDGSEDEEGDGRERELEDELEEDELEEDELEDELEDEDENENGEFVINDTENSEDDVDYPDPSFDSGKYNKKRMSRPHVEVERDPKKRRAKVERKQRARWEAEQEKKRQSEMQMSQQLRSRGEPSQPPTNLLESDEDKSVEEGNENDHRAHTSTQRLAQLDASLRQTEYDISDEGSGLEDNDEKDDGEEEAELNKYIEKLAAKYDVDYDYIMVLLEEHDFNYLKVEERLKKNG